MPLSICPRCKTECNISDTQFEFAMAALKAGNVQTMKHLLSCQTCGSVLEINKAYDPKQNLIEKIESVIRWVIALLIAAAIGLFKYAGQPGFGVLFYVILTLLGFTVLIFVGSFVYGKFKYRKEPPLQSLSINDNQTSYKKHTEEGA
jgi:hypothetical protein